MKFIQFWSAVLCLVCTFSANSVQAQVSFGTLGNKTEVDSGGSDSSDNARGPIPVNPTIRKYRAGMVFEATSASPCSDVLGTVPVPMEFLEQKVRVLEENLPKAARCAYRELKEGGVKELVLKMGELRGGQKVEVLVIYEVTRYQLLPPKETACYSIPKRPAREIKNYLRSSSKIESDNRKIRELVKATIKDIKNDWDKVAAIFDYVRANVKYNESLAEQPMQGALAAIRNKEGDCEDMCALFIAMCRNSEIPARLVRVSGHCYAEFYLVDEKDKGYWFPAQVAGTEPFGGMLDSRVILQKGDAFHLPESPREETLYVKPVFTGQVPDGGKDPKYIFIGEDIVP